MKKRWVLLFVVIALGLGVLSGWMFGRVAQQAMHVALSCVLIGEAEKAGYLDTQKLRAIVLQCEIEMTGRRSLEVRELPFDPDVDKSAFQHLSNFEAEFRDRIDLSLKFGVSHRGKYSLSRIWINASGGCRMP